MKSRLAFGWSVDRFPGKNCYLWTFTFREAIDVNLARRLWSAANNRFKMAGVQCGPRAFEMHPGGHGLHIHVVTPNFYRVERLRFLWTGPATIFLGGRIHVKVIPKEKAHYLTKYLTKQGRPPCLKGARLWASVGGYVANKVADIECFSFRAQAYRVAKMTVAGFAEAPYWQKWAFVTVAVHNYICAETGAALRPVPPSLGILCQPLEEMFSFVE